MGGRGKKFGERKQRVPRPPKPPKAKKARATRVRTSRQTKQQILTFSEKAQKAIDKAQATGKNTVSFESLTGKRVRAASAKVLGNVGKERIAANIDFKQLSIPIAAKNIPITGKGNILNVHKWHKGTEYDEKNTRPFRAQLLKNGKFMLDAKDATRFAHYIATGGNQKNIRITYNDERMTSKKIAQIQAQFPFRKEIKGDIPKRLYEALNKYENQTTARALRRELGGDRTTVPARLGGTTGNRTGETRRSETAPRGKRTGIYNPEATTGTRQYPAGRKSRQTEASKASESAITIVPASQAGRNAQNKRAKKGKRKGSRKRRKNNNA